MAKPGRRPTPTVLKIATGNPGKRKLNKNEPKPANDNISPPDFLDEKALEKWDSLVPIIKGMGLMTNADVDTIARYCAMHSLFIKYLDQMNRGGDIVVAKNPDGTIKNISSTPASIQLHKLATALLRIEQEYGLTASSRGTIDMKKLDDDPLDSFLSDKTG